MKNRSAAPDHSPSACQLEKLSFFLTQMTLKQTHQLLTSGPQGPTCRAVPEVCPREWGLQVRSRWPRPDQHGRGWQLPTVFLELSMQWRMPSIPLPCPGMLCGAGDAPAPVHWSPDAGQHAARQQPRSPRLSLALPDGGGIGRAAQGALAASPALNAL